MSIVILFYNQVEFEWQIATSKGNFLFFFLFSMSTVLLIIMLIAGITMSLAVLLMSPKGGLWFWLWWASSGWNEYGTKKSIESSLKVFATVWAIVFICSALIYPFTKPKKFDADAAANSWAVAPSFDLGWGSWSVQITDEKAPSIVIGSGQ